MTRCAPRVQNLKFEKVKSPPIPTIAREGVVGDNIDKCITACDESHLYGIILVCLTPNTALKTRFLQAAR